MSGIVLGHGRMSDRNDCVVARRGDVWRRARWWWWTAAGWWLRTSGSTSINLSWPQPPPAAAAAAAAATASLRVETQRQAHAHGDRDTRGQIMWGNIAQRSDTATRHRLRGADALIYAAQITATAAAASSNSILVISSISNSCQRPALWSSNRSLQVLRADYCCNCFKINNARNGGSGTTWLSGGGVGRTERRLWMMVRAMDFVTSWLLFPISLRSVGTTGIPLRPWALLDLREKHYWRKARGSAYLRQGKSDRDPSPDPEEFLNLFAPSLSEVTSTITCSWRSEHFFQRYEPNCGKMPYFAMMKSFSKILNPVQDANDLNLFFLIHRPYSSSKILFYYVKLLTNRQTDRKTER